MRHLSLLLLLLAACVPDVPAAPSFQQHVLPILAANCVRCHGTPAIGGAPEELRLDVFGDSTLVRDDDVGEELIAGAASVASALAFRVIDPDAPMPPRFPLDDYQIETLARWGDAPLRGAPRPGNHPPTIVVASTSQHGDVVTILAHVGDPDPDIVGGVLRVRRGATVRPIGLLRSGPNAVAWDTAGLARGTYDLVAVIDDGAAEISIELGTVTVEAP
ncbi:MAG: hypothetical protein M3680_06770 [Myxococcota bacterium]|nr:hypothetical protein [Myxococcota bacterium]